MIYRVEPRYPAIARQLRMEGTVVVKAYISRERTTGRAQVVGGRGVAGASRTRGGAAVAVSGLFPEP